MNRASYHAFSMLALPLLLAVSLSIGAAVPAMAQGLPPVPVPPGNPLTEAKIQLGRTLFWDEQLSSSKTVACGTCHLPEAGGSDARAWLDPQSARHPGPDGKPGTSDDSIGSMGVPESTQAGGLIENALFGTDPQVTDRRPRTVVASAYMRRGFWDGRAGEVFLDPETGERVLERGAALESQSLAPLLSSVEMGAHGREWSHVVRDMIFARPLGLSPSIPSSLDHWIDGRGYPELFEEAFGSDEMSAAQFAMAIASYERTLIPDRAPILQADPTLTALEREGQRVFQDKHCAECHATRLGLFSDREFHFVGASDPRLDRGLGRLSGEARHDGLFMTPTLLGVELRAPYFHDGSKATLDDVLDFYDEGGEFGRPDQRELVAAEFTDDERMALLAFLGRPLTDPRLLGASGPFERPLLSTEGEGRGRRSAPIRGLSGPSSTPLEVTPSLVRAERWRPFVAWLPGRAATLDHRAWVHLKAVPTEALMEMSFDLPSVVPEDPALIGANVLARFRPLFANRSIRDTVVLTIVPAVD